MTLAKKKNNEAINYCLNLKKQMRHLIMQNSFVLKTDGTKYDFNRFSLPLKFIEKIHNYKITLNEAIDDQVLKSAEKLQDARDDIIDFF